MGNEDESSVQCLSYKTSVQVVNSNYMFNNIPYDINKTIGVCKGTYILSGIPNNNPLGFVIKDPDKLEVSGTLYDVKSISVDNEDIDVNFYTGTIELIVKGDFVITSYICYNNEYMGYKNRLVYKSTCDINLPVIIFLFSDIAFKISANTLVLK